MTDAALARCFSCGALVPDIVGPTHEYMLSSPGCWQCYGELLAMEYEPSFYNPNIHRITVDSYAVSHPGTPERRAIQSVNVHLVSLYCVFEQRLPGKQATKIIKALVDDSEITKRLSWLAPPDFSEAMVVTDVLRAGNREDHERLVTAWGQSLWNAWKERHLPTIESTAAPLLRALHRSG
ncbi:MAG: DUF5946 family protein [Gemmatimonadales bacterium]